MLLSLVGVPEQVESCFSLSVNDPVDTFDFNAFKSEIDEIVRVERSNQAICSSTIPKDNQPK